MNFVDKKSQEFFLILENSSKSFRDFLRLAAALSSVTSFIFGVPSDRQLGQLIKQNPKKLWLNDWVTWSKCFCCWAALAHCCWQRSFFLKLPATDRLICASNKEKLWGGKKSRRQVSRLGRVKGDRCFQFVWQWHICTGYLNIESDLKLYSRPCVTLEWRAVSERSFLGQCEKKKEQTKTQTSCLYP